MKKSKHTRAHGQGAHDTVHIPGTKHHSAGLGKPHKLSESAMNAKMTELEGQHRSIYANPYKRTAARREKRLTDKPL